jgi:hypothetical protein
MSPEKKVSADMYEEIVNKHKLSLYDRLIKNIKEKGGNEPDSPTFKKLTFDQKLKWAILTDESLTSKKVYQSFHK